MLPLLK